MLLTVAGGKKFLPIFQRPTKFGYVETLGYARFTADEVNDLADPDKSVDLDEIINKHFNISVFHQRKNIPAPSYYDESVIHLNFWYEEGPHFDFIKLVLEPGFHFINLPSELSRVSSRAVNIRVDQAPVMFYVGGPLDLYRRNLDRNKYDCEGFVVNVYTDEEISGIVVNVKSIGPLAGEDTAKYRQ